MIALPRILSRPWKRLGLRVRLAAVVVGALASISLVVALYFPGRARAAYLASLEREVTTSARLVAGAVAPALLFDDPETAQDVLTSAATDAGFDYLVVENASGSVFAATGLDLARDAGYRTPASSPARSRLLSVSVPVAHTGKGLGVVYGGRSLDPIEREIREIQETIATFALLTFLVATAIASAIGSLVTRPLVKMADTAKRISAGDWQSRAPELTGGEIGALARALNRMLDRIVESTRDLERLNAELESRVAERTRALEMEIEERNKDQRALRRANQRFELAAAAIDGAVYELSVDAGRIEWSDGLARVFGHAIDGVSADPKWWLDLIAPEDRERVASQLRENAAEGHDFVCEYRVRAADGSWRDVLDRGRLLAAESAGGSRRFVGVRQDVTALRELETQYRHAQRMEAVGRLAGGVAHDFNNLMTTVLGYTEILIGELAAEDPRQAYATEIRASGERAVALTRQLLAFSRKQRIEQQVVDLSHSVAGFEPMLARMLGEDVELRLSIPREPLTVLADPGQIEQLVMNVAVNARDAMPLGGRIEIRLRGVEIDAQRASAGREGNQNGSYVCIEVEDHGCGMSPEVAARAFEPFFTTKPIGKGTGLGLAIVYGIVEQNGGFVEIDSREGVGTRVSICLPRVAGATRVEERDERSLAQEGSERVLLVEDEPSLRALFGNTLRRNGYQVTEASDGSVALALLARQESVFDLLLSDVVMPGMSGFALVDEAQRLHPGIKCLLMSGYSEEVVERYGEAPSSCPILSKPISLAILLREIRAALDAG